MIKALDTILRPIIDFSIDKALETIDNVISVPLSTFEPTWRRITLLLIGRTDNTGPDTETAAAAAAAAAAVTTTTAGGGSRGDRGWGILSQD